MKLIFFNAPLDKEVYAKQSPSLCNLEKRRRCTKYKLNKALYGLKQAPRASNTRIELFLHDIGFKKGQQDHNLYVKANDNED